MFKEGEKIFYIDTKDGVIESARFIEKTDDGTWIRIEGHAINTFVYADYQDNTIFSDSAGAEAGLEDYKNNLKAKLTKNNFFLKDVLARLEKQEGKLYLSILKEIFDEKINCI